MDVAKEAMVLESAISVLSLFKAPFTLSNSDRKFSAFFSYKMYDKLQYEAAFFQILAKKLGSVNGA